MGRGNKKAMKLLIEKMKKNPVYVALMNVMIFICLYLIIVSTFWLSMVLIALAFLTLLYLEKRKLLEAIFEIYSKYKKEAWASLIVLLVIFPFTIFKNSYFLHISFMACVYSIIALGLNLQMGSTNMVNFAPAAFFGTGAYTTAILATRYGVNPWISSIAGIILAIIIGYLIGLPTLKTKGYYLSLITLAMQTIFSLLIVNTDWLGGPNGIPGIPSFSIGSHSFRYKLLIFGNKMPYGIHYYFLGVIVLIFCAIFASRLYNSRIGLAWNAIGSDETSAICQGIDVSNSKLLAFCIGASFAGAAGALYAHYISFIGYQDFDFTKSLIIICMVILGGMDNVAGVITGAVFLTLIDEKLSELSGYRMLLYAGILIVVLIVRPEGMIPKRIRKYLPHFKKKKQLA